MKKSNSLRKSLLVTFFTLTVFVGSFFAPLCNRFRNIDVQAITNCTTTSNAEKSYNLPDKTKDGVIAQAFTWRFKDIQSHLQDFASAGYKSILVSPVQKTPSTGEWWKLYQPCNFHIGNDQLGTYADFSSLCSEANKYGIKIIVDALLNHVATNSSGQWDNAVDSSLKNRDLYHNLGTCSDTNDRYQATQKDIGGLLDLATQRTDVQDMAISFLNECIDAGAGGFRFDSAKHIETNKGQDAGQSWSGNFWDRILSSLHNRDNLYLYGEVLPDNGDNHEVYSSYFDGITAESYGWKLRDAVHNKNLSGLLNIAFGDHSLLPSKSLCYVESHDNYEHNQSTGLSDWERKMSFAIIDARAQLTPQFLIRPSSDNLWKDSDIAAVNKFHNAMVGQSEYLRWPRNETMFIERGTKGMVIVNVGSGTYIDSETNLKNGTYTNKASGNCTLTVSNGRIKGNIPEGQVIVLYNDSTPTPVNDVVTVNPETPIAGQQVTITYNASGRSLQGSSYMKMHWGYDSWKDIQDTSMISLGNDLWQVTVIVPSNTSNTLNMVFTNGSTWDNNNTQNWNFKITK